MADHLATAALRMALTWGLFVYGATMLWASYRAAQAVGKGIIWLTSRIQRRICA